MPLGYSDRRQKCCLVVQIQRWFFKSNFTSLHRLRIEITPLQLSPSLWVGGTGSEEYVWASRFSSCPVKVLVFLKKSHNRKKVTLVNASESGGNHVFAAFIKKKLKGDFTLCAVLCLLKFANNCAYITNTAITCLRFRVWEAFFHGDFFLEQWCQEKIPPEKIIPREGSGVR